MRLEPGKIKSIPAFDKRTVLGVLLIIAALVGGVTLAKASRVTIPVLAASRDIRANVAMTPSDVEVVEVRLPDQQARRLLMAASADEMTSVITSRAIRAGELLRQSDFARRPNPLREVSFPVAPEASLQGGISEGDRVDVVATLAKGNPDSRTLVVARNAEVVVAPQSPDDADGMGSSTDGVVTVAVEAREAMSIAFVVHNGEINLVRSTGPEHPLPSEIDIETVGAGR